MIQAVRKENETFLANYSELLQRIPATEPDWLRQTRKAAILRVSDLGLPTTRDEEWKYTNLAPLQRTPFRLSGPNSQQVPASLAANRFSDLGTPRLTFVNGFFRPDLSDLAGLPLGVTLSSLSSVLATDATPIKEHFGRLASIEENVLNALNTAFTEDGSVLTVEPGTVLSTPIQLFYLSTREASPFAAHPRNLFVVGANSELTINEIYLGEDQAVYFNNPVTELIVGENSTVDHQRVQLESSLAYHIGTLTTWQGRSSNLRLHTVDIGGSLVRNNLTVALDGSGSDAQLDGVYLGRDEQHIDNHTRIEHRQPHCTSRELYKGIMTGHSRAVFHGRIVVSRDAQKTDSKQTNNNLLLSDHALVNTKPQLEIYADDVKCTHGATIGRLEEEALFYLRSRGIGQVQAASLLIYAFASEIMSRVKTDSLRERLDSQLFDWLARAEIMKERR